MRAGILFVVAVGGAACAVTGCIFDQGSYEGGGRRGRVESQDAGTGGAASSSSSSGDPIPNPPADSGAKTGDT